jgi:DNA polymerase I-like protein with 3'-5' exonuclease and polymerase domains
VYNWEVSRLKDNQYSLEIPNFHAIVRLSREGVWSGHIRVFDKNKDTRYDYQLADCESLSSIQKEATDYIEHVTQGYIDKYKEATIGNSENPEFVFVIPSLRSDGKVCSYNTVGKVLNLAHGATSENSAFVPWILESVSEKKIKKRQKDMYTPFFWEYVKSLNPKRVVTFGDKIPSYLLDWKHDNLRNSHGTFFKKDDIYVIPVYGLAAYKQSQYREMIQFDLSERLAIDPDSIEFPEWEQINNDEIDSVLGTQANPSYMTFDIESDGLDPRTNKILMLVFQFDAGPVYVLPHPDMASIYALLQFCIDNNISLIGHNVKFDLKFLYANLGNNVRKKMFAQLPQVIDTMSWIAARYGTDFFNLKHLSNKYLMRLGNNAYKEGNAYDSIRYAVEDVYTTWLLFKKLGEPDNPLFEHIANLNYATLIVEITGFFVDKKRLKEIEDTLGQEQLTLYKELVDFAGNDDFNPNSGDQLAELFIKLGAKLTEQTPSGKWKMDAGTLESIKHPLADKILRLKALTKASGYITGKSGYNRLLGKGTKLYPRFLVHGTDTGRLASRNPNAQNIPNDHDIKTVFTSRFRDKGVIAEADYAQAELRVAAMLSGDLEWAKAVAGEDAHSHFASVVFGHEIDKSIPEHKEKRQIVKSVVFGTLYGGTPRGLAQRLRDSGTDVSNEAVQRVATELFGTYHVLDSWLKQQANAASTQGITYSPMRRLFNYKYMIADNGVWGAQRAAKNYPIQSGSADLLGHFMYHLIREFQRHNLKSVICNTVHDSVIMDILIEELDKVRHCIAMAMDSLNNVRWFRENPTYDTLPMVLEFSYAVNWQLAKTAKSEIYVSHGG